MRKRASQVTRLVPTQLGTRCPHVVRQLAPAPRQARVCAACPPACRGPVTVVRQHRGLRARSLALAGSQTAAVVLLVRVARPGLDAGALRQYIATPGKESGKATEGQWQERHSRVPSGA